MSNFSAEPVPAGLDQELSSYLDRQFNAIQNSMMSQFVLSRVAELPGRPIAGAIVYLENDVDPSENGFYGCVKINSQGEAIWKKIQQS